MTENSKLRTITMTDTPPVRVREADWPVIAHGRHYSYDGQYDFQANWLLEIDIRVRKHTDGRMLVYGKYEYIDKHAGGVDVVHRAGRLYQQIEPVALVGAIRDVGETIAGGSDYDERVHEAVAECIAELPPMDL